MNLKPDSKSGSMENAGFDFKSNPQEGVEPKSIFYVYIAVYIEAVLLDIHIAFHCEIVEYSRQS